MPSQRDDCLFCQIVRDGTYVARTKGFVAINDINPQSDVHILVIPERHVASFREIAEFPAKESQRMLEFIADTALGAGLTDYRVSTNVGRGAGQTVFHLHWHIQSGDHPGHVPAAATTAVSEL